MTDRRSRAKAALAELQSVLQQPAGRARVGSREKVLTAEEAILALLRKAAVGGDAAAFRVLRRFEKVYPPVAAALERALSPDQSLWSFFICRAGVVEVPQGADLQEVSDMIARGITEDEKAWLEDLARPSFERRLTRPTPATASKPDAGADP